MRETLKQLRELKPKQKALIVVGVIAAIGIGILLGVLGLDPSTL